MLSNPKISIDDLVISSPRNYKIDTDHFLISFCPIIVYHPVAQKSARYVFDYARADMDGLCSHLLDVDYNTCLCSTFIHKAMLTYILKRKIKSHTLKWFNSSIKLNCLRTSRKKHKKYPTEYLKIESLENNLRSTMSSVKSVYESELINSFGPKDASRIYKYIKSISGQNSIPITVSFISINATSVQEKASTYV